MRETRKRPGQCSPEKPGHHLYLHLPQPLHSPRPLYPQVVSDLFALVGWNDQILEPHVEGDQQGLGGWRAGVMAERALISPSGLPNSGAGSGVGGV